MIGIYQRGDHAAIAEIFSGAVHQIAAEAVAEINRRNSREAHFCHFRPLSP
jgi:hypothetical protein